MCLAVGVFAIASTATAETRPNVIVILADDLGFGDLGCYGHPDFKTPRIDQMALEGARLTFFNTPLPFCAPTRASLMTGRYPFRCGMSQNPAPDGGPKADALALPSNEITLAELLKKSGYATSLVGKWHLGHKPGSLPTDRGFDDYFGIPYSNDMRPVQLLADNEVVDYPVIQSTLMKRYDERAVDFIRKNKERPFFLYYAHAMPHKPLAASESNYKKSGHGLYGDVLIDLDASVGRVLDTLTECGIDERTLVFFSSDNGPWFGGRTGGLRGMKGSTYEGGYRVPLIARWPKKIPSGHVNHEPSLMMDIFATIIKATDTAIPDDRIIDGRDIMPLLTGNEVSPHKYTFGQKDVWLSIVRDRRWKLHVLKPSTLNIKSGVDGRWIDPRGPDGVTILAPFEQYGPDRHPGLVTGDPPAELQLFDLQNDPGEQFDVAEKYPEHVARLKAQFDLMSNEVPVVEKIQRTPLR